MPFTVPDVGLYAKYTHVLLRIGYSMINKIRNMKNVYLWMNWNWFHDSLYLIRRDLYFRCQSFSFEFSLRSVSFTLTSIQMLDKNKSIWIHVRVGFFLEIAWINIHSLHVVQFSDKAFRKLCCTWTYSMHNFMPWAITIIPTYNVRINDVQMKMHLAYQISIVSISRKRKQK